VTSLTVENYLKAIFQICTRAGGGSAATGVVAQELGVSPGTVTSMLKTLGESGLATYMPYEGVRLTPQGTALALRITRRHRLIELFLVRTLGMSWDEVHEEAEHMEHAVSDLLVDRIDAYLGHPTVDPHGDPIPRADGSIDEPDSRNLADCAAGDDFRLVRVLDQSPDFLRFLADSRLTIGARGRVVNNRAESGALTVAVGNETTTLGRDAAQKLLVAAN
jgi:DtxR family Mn-dependent transcriptional regulator